MPKSHARRNAAERLNGRFLQLFAFASELFAIILEMTVRQALQWDVPALRVQKLRRRRARNDGANLTHLDPGNAGGIDEGAKLILGDCAQDFVVVAAGDERIDADRAARYQACSRFG